MTLSASSFMGCAFMDSASPHFVYKKTVGTTAVKANRFPRKDQQPTAIC